MQNLTNLLRQSSPRQLFQFQTSRHIRQVVKKVSLLNPSSRSDKNEYRIEEVEERVELKWEPNIPTAARLALESDPQLSEQLKRRHLKFSSLPLSHSQKINNGESNEVEKADNKHRIVTLDTLELEEDAKVPKSRVECPGCGARLHCQSKHIEGFVPADVFKKLSKPEMRYTVCYRCEILNTKRKILNVETSSSFDYDKFIIERIRSESKAHVILLVDLLDIPNSIYEGWSKLILTNDQDVSRSETDENEKPLYLKHRRVNALDIVIVGNKFDLLPNTGPLFEKSILECLLRNCALKGISGDQIKYVELISAKTGFNIERLITRLFKIWNDEGDVYLLGMANAGKSVLFNQLLSSDYCRSLASQAMIRATTSFWPGTTLHTLKFPINFLTDFKKSKRVRRLYKDAEELNKLESNRTKLYEKTNDLKHAEIIGIVGSTFKPLSTLDADKIDAQVDATYSLDANTGRIAEGTNFAHENDIEKQYVDEARRIYDPRRFVKNSAWFYDTPGILGSQEILRYFSKQELQIVFPRGILMPRVYWMTPGQTLFVGGLIRIDLLNSTNHERVLFSIMASPALPIVNPFETKNAERLYDEYYEKGNVLRVPHRNHVREKPLPGLESKHFEIDCIGNFKSKSDIVFNCFGWAAVTSRPEIKAEVRAWTLGGNGLNLREPSLLPFIVNMRKKWSRPGQAFKSVFYKKPKRS